MAPADFQLARPLELIERDGVATAAFFVRREEAGAVRVTRPGDPATARPPAATVTLTVALPRPTPVTLMPTPPPYEANVEPAGSAHEVSFAAPVGEASRATVPVHGLSLDAASSRRTRTPAAMGR